MLKTIWYWLCKYVFIVIPDRFFVQLTAFVTYTRLGFRFRFYNLSKPVSFNEKLSFIKINPSCVTLSCYADKIAVRDYVKEQIGEKYLIPLINIYKSPSEIDFKNLPDKFVLKANHGSGWNIICEDKNKFDIERACYTLRKWLKYNAFYLSREYQYKEIKPAIICEEFLGSNIYDYKFFCFKGQPKIIQVDVDRFTNHRRVFYDIKWRKQEFSIRYPISERPIEKPKHLNKMIDICKKLSTPFKFVRVDLYYHASNIYFGELTFIPGGGNEPFRPVEYDYVFGELLEI